jgi:hypothetical protein
MSIVLVGSTSGSVTLQEPAVAGTTVLTLPAVTGTVLTDTSPKAGNVIQVVQATTQTNASTATTTFTDSGLSASITPTSSSSKILILISQPFSVSRGGGSGSDQYGGVQIVRNSTAIYTPVQDGTSSFEMGIRANGATDPNLYVRYAACYLDSPATTSSTTYKTQMRIYYTGTGSVIGAQPSNGTASIILMEVAA